MLQGKTVSVIVPVYNTEKYLDHCITSIREQSYTNLEIILVNDGSTDHSEKIARKHAEQDSRIRYLTEPNSGVSVARNLGLEMARGEYILMVDSDDWIEETMIEVLVQGIQSADADISCCQYDHGKWNNSGTREIWEKEESLKAFIRHQRINGSLVNKLMKRETVGNTRLRENIRYGEDALFLWQVMQNMKRLTIVNTILYHVTLHEDSASGSGSYKPIRRDCIAVWSEIAESAQKLGEELSRNAGGQLALEAFYSFYLMAYFGYRNESDEKLFCNTLKEHYRSMQKVPYIPKSKKVFSGLVIGNRHLARSLICMRASVKK